MDKYVHMLFAVQNLWVRHKDAIYVANSLRCLRESDDCNCYDGGYVNWR